ncbi:MAG TPA: hypothetical protein VOA78_15380 [Candidatus Dormibacteraeota bacterium]|nr:hypothetical protein [Candidatus Dormibacteraeota bacterium]
MFWLFWQLVGVAIALGIVVSVVSLIRQAISHGNVLAAILRFAVAVSGALVFFWLFPWR